MVEPRGVPPEGLTGRRTWVEVSTVGGWLVAYEGDTPVFATLVSAGRGDLLPDGTMVPFSASPTGTFPITSKFVATTMESPERPGRPVPEVMYTQVFHGPYSLHGAYWHHEWGDRKSSGCINLSPRDARWLFHWTEQPVPTGWNGLRLDPARPTTLVVIHF